MEEHPENEAFFRIGEVAEMFGTSIRALRLYDKMGLFKPGFVDEETAYRHYTADQMPVLNTLLVLKGIGFRLVEIRELMLHGFAPELLLQQLDRKRESIENEVEIARFNLENVEKIRRAVLEQVALAEDAEVKKDALEEPAGSDRGPATDGKNARTAVDREAYKMSRLICLENLKVDTVLSEVLWL